ncbi:MAG: class I SAM-dependent methyltransferase [Candidatus Omnitrophica bacterium]|nr:class I SAM-dependent methyltransferase [Candidatus Omnitrophota bacterium]
MKQLISFLKFIISLLFGESAYFKMRWFLLYGRSYYAIAGYWAIDGWLTEKEARALYDTVCNLSAKEPVVVEIGSWLGKSSVILGKGLKKKKAGKLFCIDPFDASGDKIGEEDYHRRAERLGIPLVEKFIRNLKKCGVFEYVEILQGKSWEFSGEWNKEVDFLFIDGDHSYEAVLRDYLDWGKFVKKGGFIGFHDVAMNPEEKSVYQDGPWRVVKDKIIDNKDWADKVFFHSLFIAKKV